MILEREGSSQMITVDYIGGGRCQKTKKNDHVILEQPKKPCCTSLSFSVLFPMLKAGVA